MLILILFEAKEVTFVGCALDLPKHTISTTDWGKTKFAFTTRKGSETTPSLDSFTLLD